MECTTVIELFVLGFVIFAAYKLIDSFLRIPRLSGPNSQRYVLITGCDSGFGLDAARRLDAIGCHVFAACLTESGVEELAKSCSNRLVALQVDITKEESIRKAFEVVSSALPQGRGLWAVINNAGVGSKSIGPCEWLTVDDYRTCLDVNLLGTVAVTSTFLPLVKRERGRIISTSSLLGRIAPFVTSAPYIASKFALEAYSDILRRTVVWYGVSVHVIEPGAHPTRLFLDNEPAIRHAWKQTTDDIRNQFGTEYIHTLLDYYSKTTQTTNQISDVIDAYEHALLARFPRHRYLVGSACRMLLVIDALPEWLSDRIWRRILHFPEPTCRY